MSRFLTLEEIASSAFIALGMENDEYKNIFYQWAYDATRAIGLTQTNLKTAVISITNGMANLPADLIAPQNIALTKSTDTNQVQYPIFESNFWKDVPSNDQVRDDSFVVNLQGDKFVFSSVVTEKGFDRMILQYFAMPVDSNNMPLIPEYYQRAITTYIEFMYIKRLRYRDRTSVPMSEVQYLEGAWLRQKLDVITQRNQPSKPEIEGAIAQWLTMLPNMSRLTRGAKNAYASVASTIVSSNIFDFTFSNIFN